MPEIGGRARSDAGGRPFRLTWRAYLRDESGPVSVASMGGSTGRHRDHPPLAPPCGHTLCILRYAISTCPVLNRAGARTIRDIERGWSERTQRVLGSSRRGCDRHRSCGLRGDRGGALGARWSDHISINAEWDHLGHIVADGPEHGYRQDSRVADGWVQCRGITGDRRDAPAAPISDDWIRHRRLEQLQRLDDRHHGRNHRRRWIIAWHRSWAQGKRHRCNRQRD